MREREGYDGRPLGAPPLSPARQRRSGLPPACPSPFRPPSPPGPALLFPSEVAAVSLLCSSVLPLLPTSLSPRPEAGLSSCPASSGWSYHSWPLASGAFSFLWASVRACPAMNEEYDVIVLGTGLTVSAEFWAAPAPRRRGGRAGPARGEGIRGPARTPLLPGRVNPGLRLRVSWVDTRVVFSCLSVEGRRERASGWVRGARPAACGSAAAGGQAGCGVGSALTGEGKTRRCKTHSSS